MSARDALVDALLPVETAGIPKVGDARRRAFWTRFAEVAPLPLRAAFAVAAVVVVHLMPWLTGALRPWSRLDAAARDAVLARTAAWPGGADLLEVAKLVTCFLVFDDEDTQAAVRERAP